MANKWFKKYRIISFIILLLEALNYALWLTVLTWTAIVIDEELLHIIIHAFHWIMPILFFTAMNDIYREMHEESRPLWKRRLRSGMVYVWMITIATVVATDTFLDVSLILNGHFQDEEQALWITAIVQSSFSLLMTVFEAIVLMIMAWRFGDKESIPAQLPDVRPPEGAHPMDPHYYHFHPSHYTPVMLYPQTPFSSSKKRQS